MRIEASAEIWQTTIPALSSQLAVVRVSAIVNDALAGVFGWCHVWHGSIVLCYAARLPWLTWHIIPKPVDNLLVAERKLHGERPNCTSVDALRQELSITHLTWPGRIWCGKDGTSVRQVFLTDMHLPSGDTQDNWEVYCWHWRSVSGGLNLGNLLMSPGEKETPKKPEDVAIGESSHCICATNHSVVSFKKWMWCCASLTHLNIFTHKLSWRGLITITVWKVLFWKSNGDGRMATHTGSTNWKYVVIILHRGGHGCIIMSFLELNRGSNITRQHTWCLSSQFFG